MESRMPGGKPMRLTLLICALAVAVTACSQTLSDRGMVASTTTTTTTTLDAETSSTICENLPGGGTRCSLITTSTAARDASSVEIYDAIVDALNELFSFVRAWNETSLAWVTAYADDSVSVDEYIRVSYETEVAHRKLLADLVAASNGFPDSMSTGVDAFIANYRARADAFTKIVQAEVAANDEAWVEAADEYFASSNPEEALSIAEGIISTPDVAAALEAEGSSVEEMMEPWRTAFGVGSG